MALALDTQTVSKDSILLPESYLIFFFLKNKRTYYVWLDKSHFRFCGHSRSGQMVTQEDFYSSIDDIGHFLLSKSLAMYLSNHNYICD